MRLHTVLMFLLFVVILSVSVFLLSTLRNDAPNRTTPIPTPPAPDPRALAAIPPLLEACRTLVESPTPLPGDRLEPETHSEEEPLARRRIRIRGRVEHAGRGVRDFELGFAVASRSGPGRIVDWDFTDEGGTFEVALPPGQYDVLDGEGGCIGRVDIDAGALDVTCFIGIAAPAAR